MNLRGFCYAATVTTFAAVVVAGCNSNGAVPQALSSMTHTIRAASSYQVLYSFGGGPDGANPLASLVDVNGMLYGTTGSGGTDNQGTVFSITTSGAEQVLHRFTAYPDGWRPVAGLIDVDGTLYGTTYYGGAHGGGSAFSITTAGVEHELYGFGRNSHDGWGPVAGLLEVNGTFYGTTLHGGGISLGTVFSLSAAGKEHVLHSFGSDYDGVNPEASLVDVKGKLYGTTQSGGTYFDLDGTVFTITTWGREHVLYNFVAHPEGTHPEASLLDVDGTLYGTTHAGGKHRSGTVFSVTTAGTEQVVHSFGSAGDGAAPTASLIEVNGMLYGTTRSGGSYGRGTIFSISTSGTETVLHSFGQGPDGVHPEASLIDVNGTLYGTTYSGGTHGCGTVFALSLGRAKQRRAQ
jgi:uncharacterized repeat protein (TIGR03803 family)